MRRQTLEVGMRVYACIHPSKTRRTQRHDRADQGTIVERVTYKGQDRAVVEWDTGEVDELDALTGRCVDHPFSARPVRKGVPR